MGEPITEVRGAFADILYITELRGEYPDVPLFEDVNLAELTRGDDDPTFLTVPIGKIRTKSGNNRYYGEAFVQELERQVRAKRPTGMMGHEDDDPMTFPPEAIFWVGARRIGEMLWGKGYLPPGAPRERIRRYKAANKLLGTSILAMAEGVWDKARGAYDMLAETLDLRRIDIGPVEKLGIKDLALVPILTAEMQHEQEQEHETMPEKGKLDYISEMTRDDVRLLPDDVRAAIVETVPAPPEVALVQELRQALGVDDQADLRGLVAEMQQRQHEQGQAAVKARIVELATPDPKRKPEEDKSIKVESVRGLVIEMVSARNPQTIAEAETAYGQVLELQSVKDTLAAAVEGAMGPRQRTRVAAQNGAAEGGGYFIYPQEEGA